MTGIAILAHPAHLRPGKLRMLSDEIRCSAVDLIRGLADDLDVANDGVLNLWVLSKSIEIRDRVKIIHRRSIASAICRW